MMKPLRLFPDGMSVDFLKHKSFGLVASLVIILGTIGLLATKGLNFGIDFTGGMLIEVTIEPEPDLNILRQSLNELNLGSVSIQEFGSPDNILIRIPEQKGGSDAQKSAELAIRGLLDSLEDQNVDYRRVEFVGPQVGKELIKSGIYAVFFSILGILIYVWVRFEWQYGVSAIIALLHDVLAILGFFALTQKQFDLATVAAILTVAGYSINDTVVIFDRVRENTRKYKKMSTYDLANKSINETLARTFLTSFTTFMALGSLWMFGGDVIRSFVDALIVGVIVGTYSTVFIALPKLLWLGIKRTSES